MIDQSKDELSEIEKEHNRFLANICTDMMVCPHCGKLVGTLAGVPPVCPHCRNELTPNFRTVQKRLGESIFKILNDFLKNKRNEND